MKPIHSSRGISPLTLSPCHPDGILLLSYLYDFSNSIDVTSVTSKHVHHPTKVEKYLFQRREAILVLIDAYLGQTILVHAVRYIHNYIYNLEFMPHIILYCI